MRSLLVRVSIAMFTVLLLGSGITMAAASSKPGMFLYPVKKMTQKATGAFQSSEGTQMPSIDFEDDQIQEPVISEGAQNEPIEDTSPDQVQQPTQVDEGDDDSDYIDDSDQNYVPVTIPDTSGPGNDTNTATDVIDHLNSVDANSPDDNQNDGADSPSDDQGSDINSPDDNNSHDVDSPDDDNSNDVDSPDDDEDDGDQDDDSDSPDDLVDDDSQQDDNSGDDSPDDDHSSHSSDDSHDDSSDDSLDSSDHD